MQPELDVFLVSEARLTVVKQAAFPVSENELSILKKKEDREKL